MLGSVPTFSGFAVSDIESAKSFYGETLGIDVHQTEMGLELKLQGAGSVFVYHKPDHVPAEFTILNFVVPSIDHAIDSLTPLGVIFERYDNLPTEQDERGVLRGKAVGMGPDIAWFKDPAGNIFGLLEE